MISVAKIRRILETRITPTTEKMKDSPYSFKCFYFFIPQPHFFLPNRFHFKNFS